jgi:sugar lactone lactonase YvrE
MKKTVFAVVALLAIAVWWVLAAPASHHSPTVALSFTDDAGRAALAVDRSSDFAAALEMLDARIPGYDDVVFLQGGQRWLLSAMDGKIWSYEPQSGKAEPFVDAPLMAAGMHESPGDPDTVYFCASRLWGSSYPEGERVGLYRLTVSSKKIEPLVLDVPDTVITGAKAWAIDDTNAPKLTRAGADGKRRPLAFCNDLEISEDGRRIYFSEPFAYEGASMGGGAVPEAVAFRGNGRIWMHDLAVGETRLVAQGLHFPDGLLVDLHPGKNQEESILTSLTTGFQIARIYVKGSKAGTIEIAQDGLAGMCDGLDRDAAGRIWCAMYVKRSPLITWLHDKPWLKEVMLRLPLNLMPQPRVTGVLVLSPDGSKPLYSAWYSGDKLVHNASALPGPDGYVYMSPFSRSHHGIVRMKNPLGSR